MSIIMGALAGAGDALANVGARNQQADLTRENELAVGKQRSDLETQRQQTMAVFQDNLKNAPLTRLGAKAKDLAGQEVPLEPEKVAPVTTTNGILDRARMVGVDGLPIQQQGDSRGLATGQPGGAKSIDEMKANVMNDTSISEEDKAGIISQLQRQAAQANAANQATADAFVVGKTRKRTNEEALQAAVDDAKVNDPVAYAEYQARIGKPLRDERRIDVSEARAQSQDEFNRGRLERNDRLDQIRQDANEARARRGEGAQATALEKAELQSQRLAVTSLMTSTEKELERNMALQEKAMDPAEKKLYQGRVDRLTSDLASYRTALESFSGSRMPERVAPAEPDVKYDAQGRAYVRGPDGKPVLQSESKGGATPPAKPAPAPEKPGYTPPADSPAGRAAANRERAAAEVKQKAAAELQAVTDLATQALDSKDPEAAMRAQSAPGFGRLDTATQAAIFKLVNGR